MTINSIKPRVYIVEEQANPSSDFFILPVFSTSTYEIIHCRFTDLPSIAELSDAIVVLVRYIPPRWARLIRLVRRQLRALIFFMDDDVLDLQAFADMPWRYRFKLIRLSASRLGWLKRQKVTLWVSSPYLQQKYASWQPRLVMPTSVANATDLRGLFYHGSASHSADIHWLQPIVAEVLQRDTNVAFEIIGGQEVSRLFKHLPRTSVIHPMKWINYQSFIAMRHYHIGLNPLLDVDFNRARSYTKFFDITRCQAVGIYSPNTACADVITNGQDGLIVDLEPSKWVDAILMLTQNETLRQNLLQQAELTLQNLTTRAQQSHRDLLP